MHECHKYAVAKHVIAIQKNDNRGWLSYCKLLLSHSVFVKNFFDSF